MRSHSNSPRPRFTRVFRKSIARNLLACATAIVFVFACGEALCRLFLSGYVPENEDLFDEHYRILKFQPGVEGKYILRNIRDGYFHINNEGWNSTRDYLPKKPADTYRIACIGSSGTEAFQINVKDIYPQVIEDHLSVNGRKSEVYTFGKSGTQLAHSLHVTRYIMDRFQPDIVIIKVIGGTILREGSRTRYFMTLTVDEYGDVREVEPVDSGRETLSGWESGLKHALYRSKLIKLLNRRFAIRWRLLNLTRRISALWDRTEYIPYANRPDQHDLSWQNSASYRKRYEVARRYLLNEFRALEEQGGVKILFQLGPWYAASYNHPEYVGSSADVEEGRAFVKALLKEYSLRYVDLTDSFAEDYRLNGKKFDFLHDGHFNEHGHRVQGTAIANYLIESGLLLQ